MRPRHRTSHKHLTTTVSLAQAAGGSTTTTEQKLRDADRGQHLLETRQLIQTVVTVIVDPEDGKRHREQGGGEHGVDPAADGDLHNQKLEQTLA